ncbi:sigma-54-dependent Fis family transcriptional regulator [Desulforhopalus sp. IMCC35007]|uniref:sigma-54 interaction domain-containing protein n=1 Tax=Desulforhopalus sp. IMCC35007 TaxID=2569543 RepID=UPI0010ADFC06|nr:sigma 54-interacting transcriptional regulator [Desulforhopalus sp. IMCC35007]TKB10729.1 AAA family ATPase [Desulforhopalus sp. IMCC35007]
MLIKMVLALADEEKEKALEQEFAMTDIEVERVGHYPDAWQRVVQSCADIIVICEAVFVGPVESGLGLLSVLPEGPATVMLHDDNSTDIQASYIAAGAHSALYSGISEKKLIGALEATIETRRQLMHLEWNDRRKGQKPKLSDFSTSSEVMQLFMSEVQRVAASDSLLLITGETGVGKEHLAKVIHEESARSTGPFVAVNTAALPEQLLESELFGHKRGAFTGATRSRRGAFEQAHGGTIFLDEIGEMPLHLQTKLLRVLQDFEIQPIGAEKSSWVDVRVIAATNRNLEEAVDSGIFRKDLYYRLSVVCLQIPPLRKRKEDIPHLARKFVTHFKHKIGRDVGHISATAMTALADYEWPGNVRELMNVIERSMLLCQTPEIRIEDLPTVFQGALRLQKKEKNELVLPEEWTQSSLVEVMRLVREETEKRYLDIVLAQTKGNIKESARRAGITTRSLYSKMCEYGLKKENYK